MTAGRDDATDLFFGVHAVAIDTRCGLGGFLTAIELPALTVHESRQLLALPTTA